MTNFSNRFNLLKLQVEGMVTARRMSVLAAFTAKIAGTVFGLIFNIILARTLGPGGIGIYFLALTTISIGATVARLGLDMAVLRFASVAYNQDDQHTLAGLFRRSTVLVICSGIFVTFCVFIVAPYLPLGGDSATELRLVLSTMLFALVPMSLLRLQGQFFKAVGSAGIATFIQTAMLPMFLVVSTISFIWRTDITTTYIAGTYVVAAILVVVASAAIWLRKFPGILRISGSFDIRLLLKTSLPLLWVASMSLVINWTDILVLGIWTDSATVGIYGVAARIAGLIAFVLIAVNSVTAPRFAALHTEGNYRAMESLAQRSVSGMLIVVSPIIIIMMAFPEFLLQLFGKEFPEGAWLLRILVIGQLVNVAVGTVGSLLMMSGHERVIRNNTFFAITINLVGNLLLVPVYGATGAAISTALSIIVQNLVLYLKVRKIMKINTLPFIP